MVITINLIAMMASIATNMERSTRPVLNLLIKFLAGLTMGSVSDVIRAYSLYEKLAGFAVYGLTNQLIIALASNM